jgi:hypothetical protein
MRIEGCEQHVNSLQLLSVGGLCTNVCLCFHSSVISAMALQVGYSHGISSTSHSVSESVGQSASQSVSVCV